MAGGLSGLGVDVAVSACEIWWISARYQPSFIEVPYASMAISAAGFLLTGGLLGLAVGTAVESGRSSMPGVQRVARVICHVDSVGPSAGPDRLTAEVIPSSTPEGRGDESIPAGFDPQAHGAVIME
jgi:hypothetical protein